MLRSAKPARTLTLNRKKKKKKKMKHDNLVSSDNRIPSESSSSNFSLGFVNTYRRMYQPYSPPHPSHPTIRLSILVNIETRPTQLLLLRLHHGGGGDFMHTLSYYPRSYIETARLPTLQNLVHRNGPFDPIASPRHI